MVEPQWMDLDALDHACQRESRCFFQKEASDERFEYELFRRALKFKNIYAWHVIWKNYQRLAHSWVRAVADIDQINLPPEELVALSFERFWYAFQHHLSIEEFPSLASLLQYLRRCCASTVLDTLRRRQREGILYDIDRAETLSSSQPLDQELAEQQDQQQFWALIRNMLHGPQEELVIYSYFVMGLKPREIHQKYPDTFGTVTDIYRTKRKVMNRLRHAEALRSIWQER